MHLFILTIHALGYILAFMIIVAALLISGGTHVADHGVGMACQVGLYVLRMFSLVGLLDSDLPIKPSYPAFFYIVGFFVTCLVLYSGV